MGGSGNADFIGQAAELFTIMFQTGEEMGSVDLKIRLKMDDLANVTQMLMQMRKALAVPQQAGAVTVMHTANVLDVLTLGNFL